MDVTLSQENHCISETPNFVFTLRDFNNLSLTQNNENSFLS